MCIAIHLHPDVERLQGGALQGQRQSREVVRAQPMGLRAGIHPERLNRLADELESETYGVARQPLP